MVSGWGAIAGTSALSLVLACTACAEFTTFDGLVGPAPETDDGGTSLKTNDGGGPIQSRDAGGPTVNDGSSPNPGSDASTAVDSSTPLVGIAFIGAKDKNGISSMSSNASVESPATAAGQLLIAAGFCVAPSAINAPSGFTAIPNGTVSISAEFDLVTFYKISTAADIGANYSFSAPDSEGLSVIVGAYSGASVTAPINKVASSQTTSATALPTVPGAWVVGVLASGASVETPCAAWVVSTGDERQGADALMLGDSNGASTTGNFSGSCNGTPFPGEALTLAIAIAPQ